MALVGYKWNEAKKWLLLEKFLHVNRQQSTWRTVPKTTALGKEFEKIPGISINRCKLKKRELEMNFCVLTPILSSRQTAWWPYKLSHISRVSNIAFLLDWAQMSDLDFGLIQQNISIKKASFLYQGCPLSFKSGKLWLNSYIFKIRIPSN